MKRRDFFRNALGAGIFLGTGLKLGAMTNVSGNEDEANENYDMVAIMGGEPDAMFDKGIAALGGMQKFVKPGQTVVVKPNIGWDKPVENAANTNPLLVKRIVEHCFMAGAKDVYVFDHTCDKWDQCYKNSGIEDAVKAAGGTMVQADNERYYREIQIPNGKNLKSALVHEKILDSDVFINVPILKSHGGGKLTINMKNLMGVVWNRGWWHGHNLHQCIADCATEVKPDLNVIDAYRVMMKNGPRGVGPEDCVIKKAQIISTDMVAGDAAAAKIFGIAPEDVRYINYAHEMNAGTKDLESLNIKRIKIS